MNEPMNFKFEFQKVGQGLFYTGEMDESSFHFVYDCGSEYVKRLRSAIKNYRGELNGDPIDLLIVSHFHKDHVYGLESLLNGTDVDNVIIPYFTPIDRLILALTRKNFPVWFLKFLEDPVSYFLSVIEGTTKKRVKRVIIIGGKEGEKGPSPRDILPSDKKIDIVDMPDDKQLEEIVLKNDPTWKDYIKDEKLLIKNHSGYFTVLGRWMFRLFNYKVKEKRLDEFKTCIEDKAKLTTTSSIKSAIKSPIILEKLRSCYDVLNKDLNNTSLVVYHGPVGKYKADFDVCCERGLSFGFCSHLFPRTKSRKCAYTRKKQIGQFLTGDIDLNHNYNELATHYSSCFDTVSLSQIPHHGAGKNWEGKILDDLKKCKHWVSSSGCPSFYGHPHSIVALNILSDKRCFCWSNHHDRFYVEGGVTW